MNERDVLKRKIGSDGLKLTDYQFNLENYGETIPPYYSWITPEEQRRRTEEMENMMKGGKLHDGKAKDVDVGLNNIGLQ